MHNTGPPIEYCLYARKSSEQDEKQALSIDSQIKELKAIAERDGLKIVEVLQESHSAKRCGDRDVFNSIIKRLKAGEFNGLLAWAPDRLSRNAGDAGMLVDIMDNKLLTEIYTPGQRFNTANPNDKFMFTLLCSHAKLENDNKGENVKRGLRAKREAGIFPAVAPPGYVNVGKEKGDKRVIADPKRFRLVQQAIQLVLHGIQPTEALRILNEEWGFKTIKRKKLGGGPLAPSTWFEMLRNPMYCGKFICHKGTPDEKWYVGAHKPMITEEEYWQLQEHLAERGRPRPSLPAEDSYLGLFKCDTCGRSITRDPKIDVRCKCKFRYSAKHIDCCPKCGLHKSKVAAKRRHENHYLVCAGSKKTRKGQPKCPEPASKQGDIEDQIIEKLKEITIPQEFIDWAFETLGEQSEESIKTEQEIQETLQASLAHSQKRLDRLNELYKKGVYEYEGGDQKFEEERQKELATLQGFQKKLAERGDGDGDRGREEEIYSFAKNALEWFNGGGFRTRVQILNSLSANGVIRDKTLELGMDAVFVEIKKAVDGVKAILPSFEPANFAEFSRLETNKATVAAIKSTWLPGSDSNRQPNG